MRACLPARCTLWKLQGICRRLSAGKGVIREELVIKLAGPAKEALDTLRPMVVGISEHDKCIDREQVVRYRRSGLSIRQVGGDTESRGRACAAW